MATLSDYQQLANLQQAQLSGYGALGTAFGGALGAGTYGTIATDTITTAGTNYFLIDNFPYTINIQQPIVPQIQEAAKAAKRAFKSFLDELRFEIQEWHGELR